VNSATDNEVGTVIADSKNGPPWWASRPTTARSSAIDRLNDSKRLGNCVKAREALSMGIERFPQEGGMLFQHLGLGRLQDAIQAPEHGERQDDSAVLSRFVRAAQKVGDRPDECYFFGEIAHKDILILISAWTREEAL
jgi:hypothetical protein